VGWSLYARLFRYLVSAPANKIVRCRAPHAWITDPLAHRTTTIPLNWRDVKADFLPEASEPENYL
jgi:hypothetical protein